MKMMLCRHAIQKSSVHFLNCSLKPKQIRVVRNNDFNTGLDLALDFENTLREWDTGRCNVYIVSSHFSPKEFNKFFEVRLEKKKLAEAAMMRM